MGRTSVLVERLQAVTVGQQRTDSLSNPLPARSPSPFIKEAVGHQVRAALHFHILKVQMQRAKITIFENSINVCYCVAVF